MRGTLDQHPQRQFPTIEPVRRGEVRAQMTAQENDAPAVRAGVFQMFEPAHVESGEEALGVVAVQLTIPRRTGRRWPPRLLERGTVVARGRFQSGERSIQRA